MFEVSTRQQLIKRDVAWQGQAPSIVYSYHHNMHGRRDSSLGYRDASLTRYDSKADPKYGTPSIVNANRNWTSDLTPLHQISQRSTVHSAEKIGSVSPQPVVIQSLHRQTAKQPVTVSTLVFPDSFSQAPRLDSSAQGSTSRRVGALHSLLDQLKVTEHSNSQSKQQLDQSLQEKRNKLRVYQPGEKVDYLQMLREKISNRRTRSARCSVYFEHPQAYIG